MGTLISRTMKSSKKITVLSADSGDIIDIISGKDEIEDFVTALKVEEWNIAELPEGAEQILPEDARQSCEYVFSLEKPIKSRPIEKDVMEMYSYKDELYVKLRLVVASIIYQIPEAAAGYLESFEKRLSK